jgi:hypothetical protein
VTNLWLPLFLCALLGPCVVLAETVIEKELAGGISGGIGCMKMESYLLKPARPEIGKQLEQALYSCGAVKIHGTIDSSGYLMVDRVESISDAALSELERQLASAKEGLALINKVFEVAENLQARQQAADARPLYTWVSEQAQKLTQGPATGIHADARDLLRRARERLR